VSAVKKNLTVLMFLMQGPLASIGLELTGLHYYIGSQKRRRHNGIFIAFDAVTHNPHFFGKAYENSRRISLMALAYQVLGEKIGKMFPEKEFCLDINVYLREPYKSGEPFAVSPLIESEVDVTQDNNVQYVPLKDIVESGIIDEGSMLHRYCTRYDLDCVLKHGGHYISPDSVSVEALEAIAAAGNINSVLEIGCGVGICPRAAERLGIMDFTSVDASPVVCDYLRENFQYPVVEKSAFDFTFDRRWDLVLMGMPYELNPLFLEKRGKDLAEHCSTVVFQSGITAFYEFEHDLIFGGSARARNWPWWRKKQSIRNYFGTCWQSSFDWQLATIGTHLEADPGIRIAQSLGKRGFVEPKYNSEPFKVPTIN
jgi:SAM-dependent methyltransferase